MKNLIVFILSIIVMLLSMLFSGNASFIPGENAADEQGAEETDVSSESEEISGDIIGIADLFSYEDYLEFMKSEPKLPANFVAYEDGINEIGEFYSLVISSPDGFSYQVIDARGFVLTVEFQNMSDAAIVVDPSAVPETDIDVADFSLINAATYESIPRFREIYESAREDIKYINKNGIIYVYFSNKYCGIIYWRCGDMQITLRDSGTSLCKNYPKDGAETFVSKLLNAATAKETVESFNAAISK